VIEHIHYFIKATNWVSGVSMFMDSYISLQELEMSIIDPTEMHVRKHMSNAFWSGIDEWDKYPDRTVTVSARREGKDAAEYCMWYYCLGGQWQYDIVPAHCASLYSPVIPAVVFEKRNKLHDKTKFRTISNDR
jgi:hypothetical protein